ncbi:hypothetical protein M6D93_01475 [Jatrophihabitans telluris]|uniref:Polysaccharide biosynthesis protein n=1 Tax=Jatrophihabitans telluris TaxID=2038343 RepID=A0ABY4QYQ6_9ACTN|nr:hypothetical protein [Jatrophihabitans telluris]UQX88685.1 hypothetical protein M6D93_01475 [Jatrophihabitans telluris]
MPPSESADPAGSRVYGRWLARPASVLPNGALSVGAGLALLGVTSYVFLIVPARRLSPIAFAQLGVVWTALFTLGPGLFLTLEQSLAQRIAGGEPVGATVRRAAGFAAVLVGLLLATVLACYPVISARLVNGNVPLLIATVTACSMLALVHLSRGLLAGLGMFDAYGLQLGVDGAVRAAGATLLAAGGVTSVTAYAWVLSGSQVTAVVISCLRARSRWQGSSPSRQPVASWRDFGRGAGWLLAGTLAAQVLVNAGTVVVKAFADPQDPSAGHFLTAVVLTRLPLFLFAAIQASLLPGFVRGLANGEFQRVARSLRQLLVAILALGVSASLVLLVAGPQLNRAIFGPSFAVSRQLLVALSAAATLYMLAASLSQVLLALESQPRIAAGWFAGTTVSFLALLLPGTLEQRVSVAFLLGTLASAAIFAVEARRGLHRAPAVAARSAGGA